MIYAPSMKNPSLAEIKVMILFVVAVSLFSGYRYLTKHQSCHHSCIAQGFNDYEFSQANHASALQQRAPKQCHCLNINE